MFRDLRCGTTRNFGLSSEPTNRHAVSYAAPTGYEFDPVTELRRINDRLWAYTVTGRYGQAQAVIEVTGRRPTIFSDLGVFGGDSVTIRPNSEIYSYRSGEMEPTAANSTGQANIGSNGPIDVHSQGGSAADVDGYFLLGLSTAGFWYTVDERYPSFQVPYIEPDPLGARGGSLASAFNYYSNNNNNAAAGIAGNFLNPAGVQVLPSGVYYFDQIDLKNNSTLRIDATPDDPVIVFLRGEFKAAPNHDVINTNRPGSFFIFSDSDQQIVFKPNQDFEGMIYAPYASQIYVQPNGSMRGVFWGKQVNLWPGAKVFIDTSLMDEFREARVEVVQWHRRI